MVHDEPFNAVVCLAAPCADGASQLIDPLRAAIRRGRHGVLITTGCLLGAARCRDGPAHDSGAYLLVQPCDRNRQPRGRAFSIGPVLTCADSAAVAAWLTEGSLDATRLPPRLRAPLRLPAPFDPRGLGGHGGT